MSIPRVSGASEQAVPVKRKAKSKLSADAAPRDGFEPTARVDKLISDLQAGKIKYAPEIAARIRPNELTLRNFPCKKYIIDGKDPHALATEIVPRGDKARYKGAVTEDSKLSAKENVKDLEKRRSSLHNSANELFAQHTESLLVLLDGDNAAGKDGMIKHVFEINPQATVGQHSFKGATADEKAHGNNYRFMNELPGAGQIGFHNRSAYGDVVFAAKTPEEKKARLAEIKEMEYGLTMGLPMMPDGSIALPDKVGNVDPTAVQRPPMRFIKVLVSSSSAEQAARLVDRLSNPGKMYKAGKADIDGHPNHDAVQSGFAEAMAAGSTSWAPTYFVPNDNKVTGFRKFAQIADGVLQDMDPQRPAYKGDLDEAGRKSTIDRLQAEVDAALNK